MSIQLAPETEALIRERIERGPYATADELIEEALRLLDAQDRRLRRLREAIAEGDEGEAIPWTPELMEQLTREAEEMARQGLPPHADVCP